MEVVSIDVRAGGRQHVFIQAEWVVLWGVQRPGDLVAAQGTCVFFLGLSCGSRKSGLLLPFLALKLLCLILETSFGTFIAWDAGNHRQAVNWDHSMLLWARLGGGLVRGRSLVHMHLERRMCPSH